MQKIKFLNVCIIVLGLTTLLQALFLFPQLSNALNGPSILLVIQGGFYLSLIPFILGLLNAFIMLNAIMKGDVFSFTVIKSIRNIKYCAVFTGLCYFGILLMILFNGTVDTASWMRSIEYIFKSNVFALFAAVFQQLIEKAYEVQSENNLTI
tara:strand:- start:100 stop:555 length:456 start_codon:yes stop_codon:yes gene_type:complete